MATKRYTLDETMNDVAVGIEEAKSSSEVITMNQEGGIDKDNAVIGFQEKGIDMGENSLLQDISKEEGIIEPVKKRKSKQAKKEHVLKEERYIRNVFLDKKTLWKLEQVKNRMNDERKEKSKETFVSIAHLLYIAAQEYLDRKYPNLETAYKAVHGE